MEGALESGVEVRWFRLYTGLPVPVVLAVATKEEGTPRAVVASACRPDIPAAAKKAFFEVLQLATSPALVAAEVPDRVTTLGDHAAVYATPEGAQVLENVLQRTARYDFKEPSAKWDGARISDLVDVLADQDLEVLLAEVTTSDVARAGYRVVRAIVPGTSDISIDPSLARTGGSRLRDLPRRLGVLDRPLRDDEFNLAPIPLA
jgi:thiazole/oxazole-forming peptide maturase SagD family component